MSQPAKRRPPKWLVVLWILVAVAFAVLSQIDLGGDRAASNLTLLLLGIVAALATLLQFAFDKRRSSRLRLGVCALVVVAVGLVFVLFDVKLSGALVPRFDRRDAATSWDALAEPRPGAREIDLVTETEYDFAGFLGSDRTNRVDGVTLRTDFVDPPETLWRQPIGRGLSGFAVRNGFAATLEHRDDQELATLYDVDSGALLWQRVLDRGPAFGSSTFGHGPRSTPTIHEGVVYAQSVRGVLYALDGKSGEVLWSRDLRTEFGLSAEEAARALPYGRSGSPLIEGDLVVVPGGGKEGAYTSVAAFDQSSGELRWRGGAHQISMSSPAAESLAGVRQILSVNQDWVSGHDAATGEQLWAVEWPGRTASNASVSQAVPLPPNRFLTSKGYGVGSALWQLERDGERFSVSAVWQSSRSLRTKFTNVAIRDGYIYGLSEGILECVDLETGERAWKGGRFGHGQLLLVGDVLVILTEDGEVVLVAASPERRAEELARFEALNGRTWNPFALSGDRLLVRNEHEAAAFRLPTR